MRKLLFCLLCIPLLAEAQPTIIDASTGEYWNGFLSSKGEFYSTVWGGFVGVNRDTTISFGLSNIVQLGGGWHSGIVRDKSGSVYLTYKDNANGGKASYSTVPADAYGNPFTGNSDCYGWMDAFLTVKNDSIYMWGPDWLGVNGGQPISKPVKLPQPPGKRVVKLQPIEPQSSPTNDILMALTADNQIWIYQKGAKGVPYLKMSLPSAPTAIGAIGQGVFVVATPSDIYAWGGLTSMVGVANNVQAPISILATFLKAGLQLPVAEIASDWNSIMVLDSQGNLFSIGDAVHGSTGVGVEIPDWRHHKYGTTPAPWAWNFSPMELPQSLAVRVPGKFTHIRSCIGQSFHYFAQDPLGNWYGCGRNKGQALCNGEEVNNDAVFPEWKNQPFFVKINPLTVVWLPAGGPAFDSTKTLPVKVSAGIDQLIASDTTTLTGMALQQAGTITGWSWTKISGPGTLVSPGTASTAVTGLSNVGPSTFRLTAKSSLGMTGTSDVIITSTQAPLPPAPVARIIADSSTIHVPSSYVRVTGDSSTGTGLTYQWSQLSGPSAAIVTPIPGTKSGNLFSGLLPGLYGFQLVVKDAYGRSSLAVLAVTVVPVPACPVCPICPPPRTVVGLQVTLNGQVFTIPVPWAKFLYSDGTTQ